METPMFTFVGVRKHLLYDKLYNILVYGDRIIMSEKDKELSQPKYFLHVRLDTIIRFKGSVTQGGRHLVGFIFKCQQRDKYMTVNSNDLIRFMQVLSNKVTFLDITMFYQATEIIGRGASSSVSIIEDRFDSQKYAVKSLDKKYLLSNDKKKILFENEVSILQKLATCNEQKHFLHLYQIFESDTSYYLILNLMHGKSLGETYAKLRKSQNKKFTNIQIKQIMKRLLNGLNILHKQNIIHRDLKPDNLLFAEPHNFDSLTIADFGLATYSHVAKFIYPVCGTQGFMAPEVISFNNHSKKYTEKSDIFSCSIIFKWLLTGDISSNSEQILQYESQDALNLLNCMMHIDPDKRISAEEALQHCYFETTQMKQITLFSKTDYSPNFEYHSENLSIRLYQLPPFKKPHSQSPIKSLKYIE